MKFEGSPQTPASTQCRKGKPIPRKPLLKQEIALPVPPSVHADAPEVRAWALAAGAALSGLRFPGSVSLNVRLDEDTGEAAAVGQAIVDALIELHVIDGGPAVVELRLRRDRTLARGQVHVALHQTWPVSWRPRLGHPKSRAAYQGEVAA